jgi:hypothetical protein
VNIGSCQFKFELLAHGGAIVDHQGAAGFGKTGYPDFPVGLEL